MADLAIVEGPYLQQVLDHSYPVWHDGSFYIVARSVYATVGRQAYLVAFG